MNKPLAFIADEGVEKEIVSALRERYDVLYVAETMPAAKDEAILTEAVRIGKILITLDKDFGELVFRDGNVHSGVILCRVQSLALKEAVELVVGTIAKYGQDLWSAFTVIQPRNIRIRKMQNP